MVNGWNCWSITSKGNAFPSWEPYILRDWIGHSEQEHVYEDDGLAVLLAIWERHSTDEHCKLLQCRYFQNVMPFSTRSTTIPLSFCPHNFESKLSSKRIHNPVTLSGTCAWHYGLNLDEPSSEWDRKLCTRHLAKWVSSMACNQLCILIYS